MFQDDWLMRQIQEVAEAVARAFDAAAAGQIDDAIEDLDEAWSGLVSDDRALIDMVDPATAARLLGSPERVRAAVALYRAEGSIRDTEGDIARSRACYERALALQRIAHAEAPEEGDDEVQAGLQRELSQ